MNRSAQVAQYSSRDENPNYSSFPGVTPERSNQARELSPTELGAFHRAENNIAAFPDSYPELKPLASIFPASSVSTYAQGVFGSCVKTVSHFSGIAFA